MSFYKSNPSSHGSIPLFPRDFVVEGRERPVVFSAFFRHKNTNDRNYSEAKKKKNEHSTNLGKNINSVSILCSLLIPKTHSPMNVKCRKEWKVL